MKKYVVEGEGLSKKVNENEQENRQIKPISTFILWKIFPDFSNSKKFFLISCLAVANKKLCCFEPSSAYKVVFFKKKVHTFFYLFFYELVNIYIVIVVNIIVKNIENWSFILSLQNFFSFFYFLSLIFHLKIHERGRTFCEREVTY